MHSIRRGSKFSSSQAADNLSKCRDRTARTSNPDRFINAPSASEKLAFETMRSFLGRSPGSSHVSEEIMNQPPPLKILSSPRRHPCSSQISSRVTPNLGPARHKPQSLRGRRTRFRLPESPSITSEIRAGLRQLLRQPSFDPVWRNLFCCSSGPLI